MIRRIRVKGKDGRVRTRYRIISHKTGNNLGTFDTKEQAEEHLKHIKKFRKK